MLEGGQGGIKRDGLLRLQQLAQVQGLGQLIGAGSVVDFAVLEHQRQFQQPQRVIAQRIAVDLHVVDTPGVGMQRLDAFVQAMFMVLVLLLEVLGAQKQTFTP